MTEVKQGHYGNVSLKVTWEIVDYAITYDVNGGEFESEYPEFVTYNAETDTTELATPVRPGYTFAGWNNGAEVLTSIETGSYGDQNLVAVWTVNYYTAEFYADGALVATFTFTVENETLPGTVAVPEKAGYTAAWEEYQIVPQNITVNAVYTGIEYTATFVSETGATVGTVTYTMDDATLEEPEVPAKSGYTVTWEAYEIVVGGFTVNAVYTTDVYTITYVDAMNATNANPTEYTVETATFTLDNLAGVPGYKFVGWFDGNDKVTEIALGTTGNKQFTAQWETSAFAITYVLNGGENDPSNVDGYDVDDEDVTLAAPTREGYTFGGWYTDESMIDGAVTVIPAAGACDVTLYAKWYGNVYTARYFIGDTLYAEVEFTMDDEYLGGWANVELIPAKDGYTASWEEYELAPQDIVINAIYTPIVYTITYDPAEGTNTETNPTEYTIETASFTFENATRTGYAFVGWFKADDTKVEGIDLGSFGDVSLTAKWSEITYTVVFIADELIYDTSTYTYAEPTFNTPASVPDKPGYTAAWEEFEPVFDENETHIVKAIYTPIVYTITYNNLDGATNSENNPETYTAVTPTFMFEAPTKEGYTFGGWYLVATPGDTDEAVTKVSRGSYGEVVLYATWTSTGYTITYANMDGATNAQTNPATYTIESETITFADPSKTGYTFEGWYLVEEPTEEDEATTTIEAGSTGDVTVYAKWTAITYTVTYNNMEGATNDEANPATYTIEDDDYTFLPAEKDGYTFSGWYKDDEFAEVAEGIATGSNGNVTVYAKWTIIVYAIDYELNGGTNDDNNPETYTVVSTLTLLPATKTGYTFMGWYLVETPTEADQAVTTVDVTTLDDITYYAIWEATEYTITYMNMEGATNDEANPATYTIESDTITFATPEKEGCTFKGWFADAQFAQAFTEIATGSYGDVTVYAKWTNTVYMITYELNGGTNNEANPYMYTVDSTIILEPATRNGYTFKGWYLVANPTEEDEAVTTVDTTTLAPLQFYATWEVVTYTVTYGNMTNATNDEANPATYTVEDDTYTLGTPTKEGCDFVGWYLVATPTDNDQAVTEIAAGSYGDKTFYAKWTFTTYNITYEMDGGTNAQANPATFNVDTNVTFTDPTKTGYTFVGWYAVATPTEEDQAVTGIATGTMGDRTFYAVWTPTEYAVTYANMDDATNDEANPATYTIEDETYTLAAPTKTGYTFGGWYLVATPGDTDEEVTAIEAGSYGDKTFYAKWTATIYTITYEMTDGATNAQTNPATYTIESQTITLEAPTKTGYDFVGWYLVATPTEEDQAVTAIETGSYDDKTFYAVWTPTEYTITYHNLEDATNSENNPATYTIETPSFTFEGATKEGYEVEAWYTDDQFGQALAGVELGTTGNIDVYAKWQLKTYHITYVLNGGDEQTFVSPTSYNIESDIVMFSIPTRDGYAFAGWYTSADFDEKSKVKGVVPRSTGEVIAYAKWMSSTLTIDVSGITWFENDDAIVSIYVWFSDGTDAGVWPGTALTYDDVNNVYTYEVPAGKMVEGIVITRVNPTDGKAWNQTYDITDLPEDGIITLTEDDIMPNP